MQQHSPAKPWSNRTANLAHFLTRHAARLADEPAIIWQGLTMTWAELNARVSAIAHAMQSRFGVQMGDRVLVQTPNNNQIIEIMFACWRIGAIWVPSNFRQHPHEMLHAVQKARPALLFCSRSCHVHADTAVQERPGLPVVWIGDGPGETYEGLINAFGGIVVPNAVVERDTPGWLFFTSGSTGKPKASVLTHGQLTFTAINHLHDLMPGTGAQDCSLVVAPLSHGSGMHLLAQVFAGVTSVLLPEGPFDPATVWRLVETHKITNMFTVPTIVKMLTEHDAVDAYDHSSLRYVIYAGAPMYREDQKFALGKLGKVLVQYFGLGEVTGAITVLPPDEHFAEDIPAARPGTCGFERTGMEISIQDATGNLLGPHETGDICVAGPALFNGYFEDDEANAKTFRNGWFVTGDLGHMDAERYLFITGRASDMYISGGSNVYPREIEEILLTLDGIDEVAILGAPSEKWGEIGVAVCVCTPGSRLTAADISVFLETRVARYKQPHQIVFLNEMPKTGYGKITKKLVRETLEAQGLWPAGFAERST